MSALRTVREIVLAPKLLFSRYKVLGEAKLAAKRALQTVSRVAWRTPLDHEDTISMLAGHEIRVVKDDAIDLPSRQPIVGDTHTLFSAREVVFKPEYVWRLERSDKIKSMRIVPAGTVLLNDKNLLDTDFGSVQGIGALPFGRFRRGHLKRRRVDVDIAIAPWSHNWATYYEFVIHILSKVCWIKEVLDPSTWAAARVCYSLRDAPYERQYLSLLGLGEQDLVDTKYIDPVPRSMIVSNLQRASRLPTPTRLTSLRSAFLGESRRAKNSGRGVYLSREGGKRQVLNEAEVRRVVSSHGLEIIESIPVSVEEQIRLFSEAPLIVSPHGSALANLVWCSPGTRVIELFTRSFMSHLYSYMSHLLGLQYAHLVDDAPEPHHWTNMHKDMVVDVRALATALEDAGA